MSFFKRILSSVGIGSAKVDTKLFQETLHPGDTVEGVVKIKAGGTEQEIDGLYFSVKCTYEAMVNVEIEEDESDENMEEFEDEETGTRRITRTADLLKFKISDPMTLGPGEETEIPLEFELPVDTPLTIGKTKVWLHTGLDIKKAIDAGDRDDITVRPGKMVQALFDSLEALGFRMIHAECEAVPINFRGQLPFVQEFEFQPVGGTFRSRLDELEVVCFPDVDQVEVYLEMDRKARNLRSFMEEMNGNDERMAKFTFALEDIPNLTNTLEEMIDHYSR